MKKSLALKDRNKSKLHKKKLSIAKTGSIASIKTRKKMSIVHSGDKSHFWKGGITKINYLIRNSVEYDIWRTSVFERDNYICQECKQVGGNLEAHHIKLFSKYIKLRFDINNGITLCKKCHKLKHIINKVKT